MITMEPRTPCSVCGIKPRERSDRRKKRFEANRKTLAEGGWAALYFGVEADGTLFMSAAGEGESDHYCPNFCPECGRQIR